MNDQHDPGFGPGTELAAMIPAWLEAMVDASGDCLCKDWRLKMDRWGCDGCELRRAAIVSHLMDVQDLLPAAIKLVPERFRRFACDELLTEAIRRAKGYR